MKAMNAAARTRIDEWVYRFRKELEAKASKLDDPREGEIDRVARWMCDVHTWHPDSEPAEAEKR